MSVVKAPLGGTGHHSSVDSCSAADRSTISSRLDPDTSPSPGDMGGEQKFMRSSREMRNMAEKMRRDRLNSSINELAGIVPLCSGSSKRLDKTSTLRLAANFICMHKLLMGEDSAAEKVPALLGGNVAHNLAEAVGGFLLVVTSTGKIIYVTEAIEQFLGHSQVDLLGHSIYNVIHPDDLEIFQQNLIPKGTGRVSFFCRMMEKALTRNDPGRYEIIHVVGQLKPIPPSANIIPASPSTSVVSPGPRSSSDTDDNFESDGDTDNSTIKASVNRIGTHILTSFVRVVKDRPITELSLVESTLDEYITRHGLTGNILYTDHRISFVTGLMPSDVVGKSAFSYMHPNDRVWSIVAQKLMFTSTQGQGTVSYRLQCCDGTYVTLRSRGYLEVDKQTGQVESFVCINTVVSIKESDDEIKNQRRKLLPVISSDDCDDHLKSISNSFPPELIKDLMPMLTPEALQKLAAEFEISELNNERIVELDPPRPAKPSSGVSQDNLLNFEERLSEPSPYQSKAKKLCSLERFDSSPEQCIIKTPETKDSMSEAPANNNWYNAPEPCIIKTADTKQSTRANNNWYTNYKQGSVDEFTTVVTKNFSFEREQFNQTQTQSGHHFSPAASPQGPARSPFSSQYEKNCYQSPASQYSGTTYIDPQLTKNNDASAYQQNKSPNVLVSGGHLSPLGNTGESFPVGVNSVTGNIPSVGNHNFSLELNDQRNTSPDLSKPKYSPALQDDVNARRLYKQRESPNLTPDMAASPGGGFRNERNVSPSGTYPFHPASGGVFLTENTLASSVSQSSYANPQEMRDSTNSTVHLSSPAVSPGSQNFLQVDTDGSTNCRSPSGAGHQSHNVVHTQYSPNHKLGTKDPYFYQQHQNQQQLLLQQQQQQQQQQRILQHYHYQPEIPAAAAGVKHNFTVSAPMFVVGIQGQSNNSIPEGSGSVTHWPPRSGDVPCHSAIASKSPKMYSSPNVTSVPSESSSRGLQCDASLHLNTASPCSRNRNIPDPSEACYRHCTPPHVGIQSHLNTTCNGGSKTYNPQCQYSPSQNEVEGKFL